MKLLSFMSPLMATFSVYCECIVLTVASLFWMPVPLPLGAYRPTVSKTVFVLQKPCSLEHTTDNFCRFWSKIQQDPGTNRTSVSRDTTRSHVVQHTARWLVHALQFSKPKVQTSVFFRGKVSKPKTTRFNWTVWVSRFRVSTLVVFPRFRKRFSFSSSFS